MSIEIGLKQINTNKMNTVKTYLKLLFIIAVVVSGFILTSCGKEGPQGPAGNDGNANVYSKTFVVTSWDQNSSNYFSDFYIASLTSDVHDNGAVIVYFSNNNGND